MLAEGLGSVVQPLRAETLGELEHESIRNRETGEEHVPDCGRFASRGVSGTACPRRPESAKRGVSVANGWLAPRRTSG
jgi:hypothetical protein